MNLTVRVNAENLEETITHLEKTWYRFVPNRPFEYEFDDSRIEGLYVNEQALQELFGLFSALAILLACMGLTGLASFAVERRTREIGIRKVLGASIGNVITILTKEFAVLVVLANIVAFPIAYWAMSRWLQDYAYRTEIAPEAFLTGGISTLIIAFSIVITQAAWAACSDPVVALKVE